MIRKEQIDAINHPEQYRDNGFNTTSNSSSNQGPLPQTVKKNLELMKIGKTSRSCPICIVDFGPNEIVFRLPCKHLFHKACLDPWLQKNKTCACCRMDLEKYFKENQSSLKPPIKTQPKPAKSKPDHSSKSSTKNEQPSSVYMSNIHGLDAADPNPPEPKSSKAKVPNKPRTSSAAKPSSQPRRPPTTTANTATGNTTTASNTTAIASATTRPPTYTTATGPATHLQRRHQATQQPVQQQTQPVQQQQHQQHRQQDERADPTAADGGYRMTPVWQPIPLAGFGLRDVHVPPTRTGGDGADRGFQAPTGPNPYL